MDDEVTQPENKVVAPQKQPLKTHVLKTGDSFGNYRVVKCLCDGLIAQYYHMQHIRDLHDVTVGIFHHCTFGDEKFIQRLETLRKTLSRFENEGIPKIHDVTTLNERVCIFLDPVQGHTLSQHFSAHGSPGQAGVGIESSMRLIAQLLGVLGYAHSQGVDHRDLESDLIYVNGDGSIQILGLGIKAALGVKLFESIVSASVSPLVSSQTLDRLNSFDIMSPEYRAGVSEDAQVDVYAVAFIGYWLLTGCKPDLAKYEAPSKRLAGISENWNIYFEQSLQRVKEKRYQSCKIALLALKDAEKEPQLDDSGYVQRQIDRIPVPKQVVERGHLATRTYRLLIIGLVGLTLTAIAASFLKVSYMEEINYSRNVARLSSSAEGAVLHIAVKPRVAKLEFVGYDDSFIANHGRLYLAVKPGVYKLRLSALHHIAQIVTVNIPTQGQAPETLSVELKPAQTDIVIRTESGAAVSVMNARGLEIELGVADQEGTFFLKKSISAGSDQILVKKEGYQAKILENQAIEFGSLAEIDAPLLPLPANVAVRTEPSGASIEINDIEVGTTPLVLDDVMPRDSYLFVAQLEGYRPIGRRLEVKPGADMLIDFGKLTPLSGSLRIHFKVSGEGAPEPSVLYPELKVVLDGLSIPYGDQALNFVPVGERRIYLEHPLYISDAASLNVEDKGNYTLDFVLSPRPGEVHLEIPGQLETEVRFNGVPTSLKNGMIQVPANEVVEFELRIRDHFTMRRSFKLAPNERFDWQVKPVALPSPTEGQSWTLPYWGIPFAWIPPGNFEMGSPLPEHARIPNEGPQTRIRLTYGFWAGIYEVTQAQFSELMGQNPAQFKNPNRPVESVLWSQAKDFCEILTRFERAAGRLPKGYVYRLPTEVEWEYAARAETTTPFYFGDQADASIGHFRGVYPEGREDGLRSPPGWYGTATVGRYQPNAYGLYDVHGNVREWTLDRYNGRLPGGELVDPEPRIAGDRIVVRGGGWEDSAARARSAVREEISPDVESNAVGFRVVLAPEM